MAPRSHRALVAVGVVTAVVGAACSAATSPKAARVAGHHHERRVPVTTPGTTPATTAPTTAAPGLAAGGACAATRLAAASLGGALAAGRAVAAYSLRNSGGSACTLEGYPGLQLLGPSGAALPTTVLHGGSPLLPAGGPGPVALSPGAAASFSVAYSDVPASDASCTPAAALAITPPGGGPPMTVQGQLLACAGVLNVSPLRPGARAP